MTRKIYICLFVDSRKRFAINFLGRMFSLINVLLHTLFKRNAQTICQKYIYIFIIVMLCQLHTHLIEKIRAFSLIFILRNYFRFNNKYSNNIAYPKKWNKEQRVLFSKQLDIKTCQCNQRKDSKNKRKLRALPFMCTIAL